MKTCSKCKIPKDKTKFGHLYWCKDCCKEYRTKNREKSAAQQRVYRKENREKIAAKEKIYRAENREKIAAQQKAYQNENREGIAARRKENRETEAAKKRGSRYGITPDAFKRLLVEQGGVCAICGGLDGKKSLGVDHDHGSKKIRGLLCSGCNLAVGLLKDSSAVAQLAVKYLKKHGN